jgi:murein DD-endopeptidase MepM/ murein hydrolase activator NlpD
MARFASRIIRAMKKLLCSVALCIVAVIASATASPSADVFTSLAVSAFTPRTFAFPGTDGHTHLVYELLLTNTNVTPATLESVEVVAAANPTKVLATYDVKKLLANLRTTGNSPVENPTIEFNGSRLLMIQFELDSNSAVPEKLLHRVKFLGATAPSPKPATPEAATYTVAPIEIEAKIPHIGAPLSGNGWVAFNGCCTVGVHRSSSIACNGSINFAQRFAIDWLQLGKNGKLVNGDAADVHGYVGYGAEVLAVADGTVVGFNDSLDDQKPGSLPDPKTMNIGNVDGNHIVLDIGGGVYAFYAHLQRGSLTVKPGDHVKASQVLAKLGNTGNSSAPHLHFHLMQSPSVLCSNGIPYTMDAFDGAGNINLHSADEQDMSADFSKNFRPATHRRDQYPLDMDIINFAAPH